MIKNNWLFKTIALIIFCCTPLTFAADTPQQILTIPAQVALPIGVKIWFNESGGSVMGLTSWNDGEEFASLGIGHFLWHPYPGRSGSSQNGFPALIHYMEDHGINVPMWLRGNNANYCPWPNRTEFLRAQYSARMVELRRFLQQTIPIQAEYMTHHLEEIFPDLLASTPPNERPYICKQFYTLARTPSGIYALVDYLNFKGPGISDSLHNYENGSGLLQVLKNMRYAPPGYSPMQAYVWSAKNALIRRVQHSNALYHQERYLAGWFKRLNTYLEGEIKASVASTNKRLLAL